MRTDRCNYIGRLYTHLNVKPVKFICFYVFPNGEFSWMISEVLMLHSTWFLDDGTSIHCIFKMTLLNYPVFLQNYREYTTEKG